MLDTLFFSVNAILPIICLVLLGYILRQKNVFDDKFLNTANAFCFRYCFFSTMFVNAYSIKGFEPVYRDIAIFTVCSVFVLMAIGFVYVSIFIKDPKQKGVMIQSFYRSNYAIIGIPLVTMLFGENCLQAASIVLACTIPVFNASAVIFLTVFLKDENHKVSLLGILKKIMTNPMIDGILCGFICLAIRPHLNGWTLKDGNLRFIYKTIENLSRVTTPMALIILGGRFRFSAIKRLLPKISVAVFARLVLAPTLGLFAAHYLFPDFKGPEYAALLALFGSPIAVASAIMAQQMDNDGELAGQILVWTTVFSAFSLFVIIAILRSVGIF